MNKSARAKAYSDFLRSEGYIPELDKDGDIVFKSEGKTYLIIFDDSDELFFRLVFPNFWRIESPREREQVEAAALAATAGTKVAKVFPINDNVWATIELFGTSPEVIKPVFSRCLSALRSAVNTFVNEMRK